jgi:hypothetical protein
MRIETIMRALIRLTLLTLAVACSVSNRSAALAAVRDLRSALLRPSDAPPGLSHLVYKLYTHPPRLSGPMTLSVPVSGSATAHLSCHAGSGWSQGLIDFFVPSPSAPGVQMGLCAGLFTTAATAHQQYHVETAGFGTAITTGYARLLTKARIGDESVAFGLGLRAPQRQRGRASYTLIFRRANALVYLIYAGPPRYAASTFIRVGRVTNSRLH